MKQPAECSAESSSPAATARIAARLAGSLPPGGVAVHLRGELGSGKSAFARGMLRRLGVQGAIPSPSFALAQIYRADRRRLGHFDFYRCADPAEWMEAGLDEDIANLDLAIVEWPQRAAGLPLPDLEVSLAECAEANARLIAVRADTAKGLSWLAQAMPCAR